MLRAAVRGVTQHLGRAHTHTHDKRQLDNLCAWGLPLYFKCSPLKCSGRVGTTMRSNFKSLLCETAVIPNTWNTGETKITASTAWYESISFRCPDSKWWEGTWCFFWHESVNHWLQAWREAMCILCPNHPNPNLWSVIFFFILLKSHVLGKFY